MCGIEWLDTPLDEFISTLERQEDGTYNLHRYPHGEGKAQSLMMSLCAEVDNAYGELLGDEDWGRLETEGEVPVIRDGQRGYVTLHHLTLRDLPAILDTLVVLEEELEAQKREESERKAAARKERERVRAKERRKLKKLGEW